MRTTSATFDLWSALVAVCERNTKSWQICDFLELFSWGREITKDTKEIIVYFVAGLWLSIIVGSSY
jgi:hypothetical protein